MLKILNSAQTLLRRLRAVLRLLLLRRRLSALCNSPRSVHGKSNAELRELAETISALYKIKSTQKFAHNSTKSMTRKHGARFSRHRET